MPNLGIDTTMNVTPYLSCLRAAGVTFVCRYVNPAWVSFGLSRIEAMQITQAGLSTVALYEWGTTSYTAGYFTDHQGQLDAERAFASARNVGIPGGRPIYFTVDMPVSQGDLPAIGAYFDGVSAELAALGKDGPNYAAGAYGSYATVSYLRKTHRAAYLFQTYAWSDGRVLSGVNLLQELNNTNLCGFPNDRDVSWGNGGGFKVV
ncbi:MAG: DUF1906 domain-containing protein [Thermaerobacter sp.]|nr:DUF1906 domain-containing protein [Thermaerobacter sp.]